jgi:hypothetical protein
MDICARRGCQHVLALHAGRTGNCRLNGCRCEAFVLPRPAVALVEPQPVVPARRALPAWLVAIAAFVAGLVLGGQT